MVDLHRGDDQPQIDGHGLMQRQGLHAILFHLDLALVDVQVALFDLVGKGLVAVQNRPQRHLHLVFHQCAQREDVFLQSLDFSLQMGRQNCSPGKREAANRSVPRRLAPCQTGGVQNQALK